jgi:poly(3-hydroxyalkanoate) synthetase
MRERTQQEHGHNHVRWMRYWIEDFIRRLAKTPRTSGEYAVGETLAPTPGDAVMRNDLVELIRYRPTTTELRPEPILIVPAWIMKYYILDLTAQRSLVAYLRDQGFEVFIPSWNTPDEDDADLSMQDYIDLGVGSAVGYIKAMGGGRAIACCGVLSGRHVVGDCHSGHVAGRRSQLCQQAPFGGTDGILRAGGTGPVYQRESGRISRGYIGLPHARADAFGVSAAALSGQ